MQKKLVSDKTEPFSLRVKLGEYEVEIKGAHEEVIKAVQTLPSLIEKIGKSFESLKPKTVATITVRTTEGAKETKPSDVPAQNYPKISSTANLEDAVLQTLESDWGKWRPRTAEELKEALAANGVEYPGKVLTSLLDGLSEKGLVRRWNTTTGFVYILAEKKSISLGAENDEAD